MSGFAEAEWRSAFKLCFQRNAKGKFNVGATLCTIMQLHEAVVTAGGLDAVLAAPNVSAPGAEEGGHYVYIRVCVVVSH